MRQLTKTQTAIFLCGAVLMLLGAGLTLLSVDIAPYCFCVGAIAFVAMQMMQRYDGSDVTLRRLRRLVLMSDLLFLASAMLMLASKGNPLGLDRTTYVNYVHNNWVVTLLLAAILQLYTSHRIANELQKEEKKL